MLKVRTAVANCTLDRDHVIAERWARRPFHRAACPPRFRTVSHENTAAAVDTPNLAAVPSIFPGDDANQANALCPVI